MIRKLMSESKFCYLNNLLYRWPISGGIVIIMIPIYIVSMQSMKYPASPAVMMRFDTLITNTASFLCVSSVYLCFKL